ncbi:amidase [Geodermatophilus obscurus]|uniref:Amidase n=1 Tax=Geodermatophilus obscurus (strain ATCC 25078 / DSM 43160 / JCM 3152 / CCUG 61914 / KCC A-0152 / KCTC 9177 / NBRC 13315 / NRRL B-3577 / G-20) TaxID=526225 RepID=D2SF35_GEOOG|nr:amidase [Geodermatophilus obscurus]ADB74725.1 Amidase [Geodermatophilus obscurus DSM 43160]
MDASGGLPGGRIVGLPATELAARVRSGELTAVEVVRAHLAHLDAVEPRISAFRVVRREAALAEAYAVDTALTRFAMPLAGVPVAVKDNVAVAGEVCTDGAPARAGQPETRDHEVVTRLRRAGAVVVGITRMPELGLYGATDAPGTVCRNPWDTARSPAGSSGGSAAAVASGAVPLAHGNDGMGSLRLPAAACGLVTLKPGAGVVPGGIGADDWSGMTVNGALATTVADLAVAHAVLAGEEPAPLEAPGRPLRIAVSTRSPVPGTRADGPARAAVDAVVAALVAAGHTVVRRDPPITPGAAGGALARWAAAAADDAAHLGIPFADLQPRSRTHARLGRAVRAAGLVRPRTAARFRERMVGFFADVDLLLTPVVTGPPLPARPWHERSFLANVTAQGRWAPWTAAWNLAGLPALVLPAGTRPTGQPLAVQLVGPPGAERRLLWTAGELERRLPWRRYAPVFDPTAPPVPAPA